MNLVFVYGTLKRGGSNHSVLASQRYLGEARTTGGFVLYSLGEFPGMIHDETAHDGVSGELWEVSDPALLRLDDLEGVAEGLFERAAVLLAPNPMATTAHAYLYRRSTAGRTRIGSHWPVIPVT